MYYTDIDKRHGRPIISCVQSRPQIWAGYNHIRPDQASARSKFEQLQSIISIPCLRSNFWPLHYGNYIFYSPQKTSADTFVSKDKVFNWISVEKEKSKVLVSLSKKTFLTRWVFPQSNYFIQQSAILEWKVMSIFFCFYGTTYSESKCPGYPDSAKYFELDV